MEYATGDGTAVLGADLQDPLALMVQMYDYWIKGFNLVIGNREDCEESAMQRFFYNTFHWLMKMIVLNKIPDGDFDFVFFDKQI